MSLVPFYKSNSLNEAFQSEILRKIANSQVLEPHEKLSHYGIDKTITFKNLKSKFGNSERRRRNNFAAVMPRWINYAKVTDEDFTGPLSAKDAFAFLKNSKDPSNFYGFWFLDDEWVAFSIGKEFKKIFATEDTINYEDYKRLIADGIISKEDVEEHGKTYWKDAKIPKGYYSRRRVPESVTKKTYVVNPVRIKEFNLGNAQVYFLDSSKFLSRPIRQRREDARSNSEFYYSKDQRDAFYKDLAYTKKENRKKILEKKKSESYNDPNRKVIEFLGKKYVEWLESLDLSDPKLHEKLYSYQTIVKEIAGIFSQYKDIYEELYRMNKGYSYEGIDGLKRKESKLLQRIIKMGAFFQAEQMNREEQEEK